MKSKLFSAIASIVVVGSVIAVPMPAYASNGWFGGNFFSGFVNFFAQKFGLDKTQVQNALNDYKASVTPSPRPTPDPQAMQNREKQMLDKLVTAGKITTAQETAILAELAALRTKYPFTQGATPDQRKTNMQNMQNDWKTWATANGIDPTIVMPFGGKGFGGRRGSGGRGPWGPTPTPTP